MDINGTYLGFAPPDESGIVAGELEIVIDDQILRYRFATGLTVDADEAPRSLLRELTAAEIANLYIEGTDSTGLTGFQLDEGVRLIFAPATEDTAPQVTLLGLFGDEIDAIFFPAMVFTPDQVAAGLFERAVTALETEQGDPGVLPRLANNGRRGGDAT